MKTLLILFLGCFVVITSAIARPTESNLLARLQSTKLDQIKSACEKLPRYYPHSTNAVAALREMLYHPPQITKFAYRNSRDMRGYQRPVVADGITRPVVKALADYHITTSEADLDAIFSQLIQSRIVNSAMDGLKALRRMDATNAVPRLLPYLHDHNVHIVRDTMRTLAVLGDTSLIPELEPFLHSNNVHNHNNMYLFADAQAAIKKLKAKAKK